MALSPCKHELLSCPEALCSGKTSSHALQGLGRKKIRSGIEANFSDAAVFEAEDSGQASEAADMWNLHLIFFAAPLVPDPLLKVYQQFQVKSQGLTIPFLLLTEGEPHTQVQALCGAGASGFLAMPCPPEALNEAQ